MQPLDALKSKFRKIAKFLSAKLSNTVGGKNLGTTRLGKRYTCLG
jgi:hypothetical protein